VQCARDKHTDHCSDQGYDDRFIRGLEDDQKLLGVFVFEEPGNGVFASGEDLGVTGLAHG